MEQQETKGKEYRSIIEKLQDTHKGENIIMSAFAEMKTPEEVAQFFREYVEMTKTMGFSTDPEKTAKENVKIFINGCPADKRELWAPYQL